MCSESRDIFKYWEISDNILLKVHDRDMTAMEDKQKIVAYAAYLMAPLPMTLNDLESHLCCLKPF